MELDKPNAADPFETLEYLSESQIEISRNRVKEARCLADNMAALAIIDSFVRANGKANVEYETLFAIVQNAITASSDMMRYSSQIKMNLPVIFMIAFYDYLVLTGVMSEDDIERLRDEALLQAMKGGPAKA